MERWSGPGRALQEHQALYRTADTNARWLRRVSGRATTFAEYTATEYRDYWLTLAKTFTWNDGGTWDGFSQSYFQEPSNAMLWTPENVTTATQMMSIEHHLLNESVTHYVSTPLVDLITRAADLAVPEPLFPTDPPCRNGFAVFERPWLLSDLHPDTGEVVPDLKVPIRALGWTSRNIGTRENLHDEKPGVVLVLYTDGRSYQEVYIPRACELSGRPEFTARREGLMQMDLMPWQYGRSWEDGGTLPEAEKDAYKILSHAAYMRRWVLSFFRLMWQELLIGETKPYTRPEFRGWQRLGRVPEDGGVKVLQLRRAKYPTALGDEHDPDPDRQWSMTYRSVTREHWTRQWYPSLGPARNPDGSWNDDSHRRIMIDPYIRGPGWAPLVIRHNITSVTR